MRGLIRIVNMRTAFAVVAVVLLILAVDSGSVVLTKMSSADNVRDAGYKAAAVAKQGPTSRQTAVAALDAAQADADGHGITVNRGDFEIYPDGRVTLTGTKTAPTLLIKHLAVLSHWARVSTTLTVEPLPYDD